jgi:hypothetical protein
MVEVLAALVTMLGLALNKVAERALDAARSFKIININKHFATWVMHLIN